MKPIAILQHEATQGPGVLEEFLQQQGIAYELIQPCHAGLAPRHAADFRGLVVLGSNHCANEPLPWIDAERCLLQDALAHDVPVLGHCFGAQMLARAMGGRVWRNPCPNIGWSQAWVTPQAQALLQLPREITLFNWHYDTFEIPQGAQRSMFGAYCLNKGFVHGRNWAFQGHLEVTAHSVQAWCDAGREELCQARGPAVQRQAQILAQLPQRMQALRALAVRVYGAWVAQLERPAEVRPGQPGDPLADVGAAGPLPTPQWALQYQAALAAHTREILARSAR